MPKTVKQLTPQIMARIEKDPFWEEVKKMASGICARWYLVGGRVYRTAIEEMYGVKVGANESDWDFLCFDTTSQPIQFAGWTKTRGPGSTGKGTKFTTRPHGIPPAAFKAGRRYVSSGMIGPISGMPPAPNPLGLPQVSPKMRITKSARFEYHGRIDGPIFSADNAPKVDFIDIEDASQKSNASVEDYFAAVPIDIQAIALDWRKGVIWGDMALSAIKWKEIRLKNSTKLLPNLDTNLYMRDKAESLGFRINTDTPHRCYCYPESPSLLFINGCKCGGK